MNEFTQLNQFQKREINEFIIEKIMESNTYSDKDIYITFGMDVLDDIAGMECIEDSEKVELLESIWNEFSKTL